MEKQFGELSQFLENKRDVELFRSSDPHKTAIYFTNVNDDERENAKAFFEVLRFGLEGGDHQLYVRFPNEDYFVEMIDGAFGSGRGDMIHSDGKNVWKDSSNSPFNIYSHGDNLIMLFGKSDLLQEFNFMKRVASYNKGNPFCRPYPNETFVNYGEIEKALSMKFLKIPEHIRKIEYCFKTNEPKPKIIIVDYPAYNFKYENQLFRIIDENGIPKEYKIKTFQRYRDGGTTIIIVADENGKEHKLFAPQRMFRTEKKLSDKFDEIELTDVSEEEKENIRAFLGIELEPKEEEVD